MTQISSSGRSSWQEQVCCLEVASANCESSAHRWSADAEVVAATSSAPRVLQWRQQQDAGLEAVPLEGVFELTGDTTLPWPPTSLATCHAGPSSHWRTPPSYFSTTAGLRFAPCGRCISLIWLPVIASIRIMLSATDTLRPSFSSPVRGKATWNSSSCVSSTISQILHSVSSSLHWTARLHARRYHQELRPSFLLLWIWGSTLFFWCSIGWHPIDHSFDYRGDFVKPPQCNGNGQCDVSKSCCA